MYACPSSVRAAAAQQCCDLFFSGSVQSFWPSTSISCLGTLRAWIIPRIMTADPRSWVGRGTQAQRKEARRNIVLEDVGIAANTLDRYYTAVSRLSPVLARPCTVEELDQFVAVWIQEEFEDGSPLYLIADALSGIHRFLPFTKKKLPESWRLFSIWRRFEVPCRAPPITQDIVLGMAGLALSQGQLTLAALLLLAFHALLRTGEVLQLRPCDFLLGASSGIVSIPSSKSGVRHNARESVSLHDPIVLETLRTMVEVKRTLHLGNVPCWDKSGTAFHDNFQRLLKALEIEALGFKPYSLRRGGATFEMQQHGQMERCLLRGRWRNSNVARIYITDGLSLLPGLTMTWKSKLLIAKYSAVFTAEQHAFQEAGKRGTKRRKQWFGRHMTGLTAFLGLPLAFFALLCHERGKLRKLCSSAMSNQFQLTKIQDGSSFGSWHLPWIKPIVQAVIKSSAWIQESRNDGLDEPDFVDAGVLSFRLPQPTHPKRRKQWFGRHMTGLTAFLGLPLAFFALLCHVHGKLRKLCSSAMSNQFQLTKIQDGSSFGSWHLPWIKPIVQAVIKSSAWIQ